MRVALFCHSLASCWNHGNAHFLRGVVRDLLRRGHEVRAYEPADGWSRRCAAASHGAGALDAWRDAYPELGPAVRLYDPERLDLDGALTGADLVLVHEWNEPDLVARVGRHRRARGGYVLLFHDTHHGMVTEAGRMDRYDLGGYDGVLAFGEVIRRRYLALGKVRRAYTWHEAADPTVFRPQAAEAFEADLCWVGNWGDEERTEELRELLLEPVRTLGLSATVFGVRYPDAAIAELARAGIRYGGWLPNHRVPEVLARHRMSVHVPRRPYAESLPGIPTIRVFEVLACGRPLVCGPWDDAEGLFRPGEDYLVARGGDAMTAHLDRLRRDPALRARLGRSGRERVLARHTCSHRVDELLAITAELRAEVRPADRTMKPRRDELCA